MAMRLPKYFRANRLACNIGVSLGKEGCEQSNILSAVPFTANPTDARRWAKYGSSIATISAFGQK